MWLGCVELCWYTLTGSLKEESSETEKMTTFQKSRAMGNGGDCEHTGCHLRQRQVYWELVLASSREADQRKVNSPRKTPFTHPVALSGLYSGTWELGMILGPILQEGRIPLHPWHSACHTQKAEEPQRSSLNQQS